ncbi:MAG: hypothetical protein L3J06_01195 [Cyclobacteriaceae bacterium]|nr:hypothetical protein [Cyclobacteriaceae bacterium]
MTFFRKSLIGLLIIFIACTSNKIDDTPKVDCSVSTLDFATTLTDADCGSNNGTIEIKGEGGETPYKYSIDNGALQSSAIFENLASGNYKVTITDNVACSVTKDVSVASTSGFNATGTVADAGCKTTNGTFTAVPNGGTEPYAYSLNGGASQSGATFSNLGAGEYEILITDATGCDFSIVKMIPSGISYNTSVKSIIANSCATTGCHDGSSSQTNFTIFSSVQGKATDIKSRTQSGNMPKDSSLTQAEKDAIACWVEDGALDN